MIIYRLHMGSLVNGKVKDHAFGHDLHLATLHTVMQVTSGELELGWQCHHQRLQPEVHGEEPVESNATGGEEEAETTASLNPVWELITTMAGSMRSMQDDIIAFKEWVPKVQGTQAQGRRGYKDSHQQACWECGRVSHIYESCWKRPTGQRQARGNISQ